MRLCAQWYPRPVKFDGLAPRRKMRTAYIDHCYQQIVNYILELVNLEFQAVYDDVVGDVLQITTATLWNTVFWFRHIQES